MAFDGTIRTYLIAGQSNARGSADFAGLQSANQGLMKRVYIYDAANSGGGGSGQFLHLVSAASGNTNQTNTGKVGPEITLGKDLAAHYGEEVLLIKYAIGGTSLAVDWLPPSGVRFLNWQTEVTAALAKAASFGLRPVVKGILWWQGESDSQNGTWAADYEDNLTSLISAMRGVVGDAALPFIIVRLANNDGAAYPHMATVNSAIDAVNAADAAVHLVDATPYTWTDTIHVSAASQEAVGSALATQLIALG